MRIKITADSTCDLSAKLIAEHDICIVPLYVTKEGKSYKDGLEIVPQDIFDYVDAGNDPCKTAAVSVGDYEDIFAPFAKEYDAVIHLNISAEFSSCYQNACIAAEEFDNVYPVDTHNLSTGSGLVVLEAARLAREGLDAKEIVEQLKEYVHKVEASFLIDKLDYLKKGGRCSALAALGANLLSLKPCIEVVDGKMQVGKKYRGSYEKSLLSYVKERLSGREDLDESLIFLTYTQCSEETISAVEQAIRENSRFAVIEKTTAGCTISSHCGPNTLGILFVKK